MRCERPFRQMPGNLGPPALVYYGLGHPGVIPNMSVSKPDRPITGVRCPEANTPMSQQYPMTTGFKTSKGFLDYRRSMFTCKISLMPLADSYRFYTTMGAAPPLNDTFAGERPGFDDLPLRRGDPKASAWGLWGDDDELGTLNLLTPSIVKAAAAEIVTGETVALK